MSKFTNTMRKSTLIVLMLALAYSIQAQNLYLQYDNQCMDKMEYKFIQSQPNNVIYTVYRFNKNNSEKYYFETGVESVVIHKSIPGKLTKCSNISLNQTDISEINRGRKKVYLCKKLDSGWAILPIGTASYMDFNNNALTFLGPDYDFKADLNQSLGGLNLSESQQSYMSSIYYAGTSNACNQNGYLFKKSPNETCKDETTLMIVPKVGLVQDITSSGQNFELVSINNTPVCTYLTGKTTPAATVQSEPKPENIPVEYSKPIVYEKPTVATDIFSDDPAVVAATVSQAVAESNAKEFVTSKSVEPQAKSDCNTVANEGEHVVSQGESLYGIARRYGLTVNNIRSWNNITGDVIQPCSIIKVIAPEVVEQPSMTVARVNDVPMSYNENIAPTPKKIECNVDANENEHVIQQGESLSAIARKYNLKVDQLRTWNNLQNDILQPCTKLTIVAPVVTVKSVPASYSTVVKPKVIKAAAKPATKPVVVAKPKTAPVKKVAAIAKPKVIVTPKAVKPEPKKEAIVYVKKESCMHVAVEGETVAGLAKEFGVTESDFRKFNNLGANDIIRAGQVLKKSSSPCFVENELPSNFCVVPTPQSAVKSKAEVVPKNYSTTVKPKSVNTVKPSSFKKEDVPQSYNTVALPKPIKVKDEVVTAKGADVKARKYHVVKSDETIFTISKTYGISVDKLRSLNSLEPNELIIPNQLLILE